AGVNRLLAMEPGATLASVSTWADEHRGASTARWHYVNLPKESCSYDAGRDCPGGQCVVEAIHAQLRILSSDASDASRLLALKYVVHLFADVHQPLHAGHAEDRGGNQYQIQAQGRGSNLHAYWDSGLILEGAADADALLARLRSDVASVAASPAAAVTDPAAAARESCQIVAAQGFYPPRKLPPAYVETYQPVMQQRLALAGARLAAALNAAFR
ncbi:MAG: S1/P1 nuclease, partial [Burkholderiaceae bacterium]|nr:S1/P1 nuclease [Burkholderiaceae bacterium]